MLVLLYYLCLISNYMDLGLARPGTAGFSRFGNIAETIGDANLNTRNNNFNNRYQVSGNTEESKNFGGENQWINPNDNPSMSRVQNFDRGMDMSGSQLGNGNNFGGPVPFTNFKRRYSNVMQNNRNNGLIYGELNSGERREALGYSSNVPRAGGCACGELNRNGNGHLSTKSESFNSGVRFGSGIATMGGSNGEETGMQRYNNARSQAGEVRNMFLNPVQSRGVYNRIGGMDDVEVNNRNSRASLPMYNNEVINRNMNPMLQSFSPNPYVPVDNSRMNSFNSENKLEFVPPSSERNTDFINPRLNLNSGDNGYKNQVQFRSSFTNNRYGSNIPSVPRSSPGLDIGNVDSNQLISSRDTGNDNNNNNNNGMNSFQFKTNKNYNTNNNQFNNELRNNNNNNQNLDFRDNILSFSGTKSSDQNEGIATLNNAVDLPRNSFVLTGNDNNYNSDVQTPLTPQSLNNNPSPNIPDVTNGGAFSSSSDTFSLQNDDSKRAEDQGLTGNVREVFNVNSGGSYGDMKPQSVDNYGGQNPQINSNSESSSADAMSLSQFPTF